MNKTIYFFYLILFFLGCKQQSKPTKFTKTLFKLHNESCGIVFSNDLTYTEDFNPYLYRNFYNGGGVAVGDINNDGLLDIYFTGNMTDNALYLNKGNFKFEDISKKAGVTCPNVWSSGATFVDINADGLLDIYVCKAGRPDGPNRNNELFINQGNLTFKEESKKYGLDIKGLSVQAAFFDFDKDGDLDCYLLNNSLKSVGAFDFKLNQRLIPNPDGNKFLINKDNYFFEATEETGIYSSNIGFGLGITLGDFNHDFWTDIYISNDFFERDYLYINQKDGTYKEMLEDYFSSTSMGAMGADYADLNNDLKNELIVTEMLPKSLKRKKTKTIYESWDKHQLAVKKGYFNQFARNTLQTSLTDNNYVEIARSKHLAATDWSWSALLFDMDNDGLKDIYITNGIYKDLLDRDYLTYDANDIAIAEKIRRKEPNVIKNLIDAIPSKPIPNQSYKNLGDLNFENTVNQWGLDKASFSNGATYADLDNDGDLDLVVNNVNMRAFVYENTTKNKGITIKLKGDKKNLQAIGAKLYAKTNSGIISQENYNARGFQSSTANSMHFGLKNNDKLDSLWVVWPNGKTSLHTELGLGDITLKQNNTVQFPEFLKPEKSKFTPISSDIEFTHLENKFVDFNKERLLPQMYSNEGPAYTSGNINNDGIPDLFIGGAKFQQASIFISSPKGYRKDSIISLNSKTENVEALLVDMDMDGDDDLYIGNGGKAFSSFAKELNDEIYINENGKFVKHPNQPKFINPINTGTVSASDFDKDGDIDLFVGERFKNNYYGLPGSGYLLINDGLGNYTVTNPKIFNNIGMITTSFFADINNDGWDDLVVAGEWMPLMLFLNNDGTFVNVSEEYHLQFTNGLWNDIKIEDINADGKLDIIAGNLGTNTFLEDNIKMFISDFDNNGFQEQIVCVLEDNKYYPIVDKDELIAQIPSLKKKFVYYKDYAQADINSLFDKVFLDKAIQLNLNTLKSTVFLNQGNLFNAQPLPEEYQYSPIYAIKIKDIDGDGKNDFIFGGNQHKVKPQFGSYDGSRAWVAFGRDQFWYKERPYPVGVKGQIRHIDYINNKILFVRNNEDVTSYKLEQ